MPYPPFVPLVPLPVKYRLYFGEPMTFTGRYDDEDSVIDEKVKQVQDVVKYQKLIERRVLASVRGAPSRRGARCRSCARGRRDASYSLSPAQHSTQGSGGRPPCC